MYVRVCVFLIYVKRVHGEQYIPKIYNKINRYNAYANVNIHPYTYICKYVCQLPHEITKIKQNMLSSSSICPAF